MGKNCEFNIIELKKSSKGSLKKNILMDLIRQWGGGGGSWAESHRDSISILISLYFVQCKKYV